MNWKKVSEVIYDPISGEWGDEGNDVKIIRTTNFTNEGKLNLSEVVCRNVDLKKIEKKKLEFGDTIIEKSGGSPSQPVGRVVYFDITNEIFLCNNFTSVLRLKDKNFDSKYFFWFLFHNHQSKNTLKFQNKTTGIINLQLSRYINELDIKVRDLATQQHIAQVLDQADALRQQNRQLLGYYDELLQSTFIDLFGKNAKDYDSWILERIENIVENKKGSMRSGPFGSDLLHSEFVNSGIFVLGIDNVVHNRFEWARMRYITEEKYQKLKRYTVFAGDLLISIMATVGRIAIVPQDMPLAINSKHLAAITLDKEKVSPAFIAYNLHSNPEVTRQIAARGRGAIMEGLNLGLIKEVKIKIPPLLLQQHFAKIVEEIEAQKSLVQQSLAESEALFEGLLAKYFG